MTDGRYPGQTLRLFSHDETADVGATILLVIGVPGQAEVEQAVGAVQLAVEVLSLTVVNHGVVRQRILHLPGRIKHGTSITTIWSDSRSLYPVSLSLIRLLEYNFVQPYQHQARAGSEQMSNKAYSTIYIYCRSQAKAKALYLSSLWSDLSCAAELVIAGAPAGCYGDTFPT